MIEFGTSVRRGLHGRHFTGSIAHPSGLVAADARGSSRSNTAIIGPDGTPIWIDTEQHQPAACSLDNTAAFREGPVTSQPE